MAGKTFGSCACGCDELITHEGSSYAGADEATRNRHRAKAAYKRRSGGNTVPGTREALAELGLTDDVTTADLANVVASAVQELARRVAGLDSAAMARELEKGLQDARGQVEDAEGKAARATVMASKLTDELTAAVERADQADEDALTASKRADELAEKLDAMWQESEAYTSKMSKALSDAEDAGQAAQRRAERAESLIEEMKSRLQAEKATALAELRAELTERIGELRAELATARAEASAERGRAERAEKAGGSVEPVKAAPTTRARPSRAKKPPQVSETSDGK